MSTLSTKENSSATWSANSLTQLCIQVVETVNMRNIFYHELDHFLEMETNPHYRQTKKNGVKQNKYANKFKYLIFSCEFLIYIELYFSRFVYNEG